MAAEQHEGCPVIAELMRSCHDGEHDECVHLVEDVIEEGLLTLHSENVLRVCTCACHAGCPAVSVVSESRVFDAGARKDSCTCWETRHSRQGSAPVDHARAAAVDDGPMVELSDGFSMSRGCVVAAPVLVLVVVGLLVGVHASHGTVRALLWILTLPLLVVTVPLTLIVLAGVAPSILRSRRERRGAALVVAALIAIGIGVVVGFGVVVTGPSDLAASVILTAFAFSIYTGRSARFTRRSARWVTPRARHYVAAYVFLTALACAATGIALLT